jgi:hypothetical protein
MPDLNAFILYNEKETTVSSIVEDLQSRGVSTYFWRQDIDFGEEWKRVEGQKLNEADAVVVLLGDAGWGPNHLAITKEALAREKRIIPVLIGNPPEADFEEANGLFRDRRYLDLKKPDAEPLQQLVEAIFRPSVRGASYFDRWVNVLVDGSEVERADLLRQIQLSTSIDKPAFAARLRTEISEHFNPKNEDSIAYARRNPKQIPSVRSWMLSTLIWIDAENDESRGVILTHLRSDDEPDRDVRYWVLAGLYQCNASYLQSAAELSLSDAAPDVSALAQALANPQDASLIQQFRSKLLSDNFQSTSPILRVLRIVPILELVGDVCTRLRNAERHSTMTYDALYALSHPEMARAAVGRLLETPGINDVVERVIAVAIDSDANALRNFTTLLAAFDRTQMDKALAEATRNPQIRDTALRLRAILTERRQGHQGNELFVAGFASDTIDVTHDPLNIREDVQTLTAVMLASEVKPPLAIGLFGDWGSGKSYFMRSMIAAAEKLSGRAKKESNGKFCAHIVQIEFNAWHYVDTNLWASLVSHILACLVKYVSPVTTQEQQQAKLLAELGSAKAAVGEAEAEKKRSEELIKNGENDLKKLQKQRQAKEMQLRALRTSDLQLLLSGDADLKQELRESLDTLGIPAGMNSISDLSAVVSEAYTVRGRLTALFLGLVSAKHRKLYIFLLLLVLFGIPILSWLLHDYFKRNTILIDASAFIAEGVAILTATTKILRNAISQVKTNLAKVESAKQKAEALTAKKRNELTPEEANLQLEIASLKAQEEGAASRLSAAAARVRELEERIEALKEGRSLARFLVERTQSEDYRKHLGLISTIRQDFESLATSLEATRKDTKNNPVERIILYIDDLDRCPTEKVMEVLQAVHLILAYPLFVVVVGVDPRWLLHSLGTTYSAFQGDGRRFNLSGKTWRTTPQNYLEKIFQIPFSLRSMSSTGFGKLMERLLSSTDKESSTNTNEKKAREIPHPNQREKKQPGEVSPQSETGTRTSEAKVNEPMGEQSDEITLTDAVEFFIHEDSLKIRPWEAKFAKRLFSLISSPRAAKRFSNIYRVLKAPVRREHLFKFEGTEEFLGEFQLPMLLLAVVVSSPSESAVLLPALLESARRGHSVVKVLRRFDLLNLQKPTFVALEEKIKAIVSDNSFPDSSELVLEWVPRVSRFSFEVARAIQTHASTDFSRQD